MLEFRDCPHCGKRIRLDATRCHRCERVLDSANTLTDEISDEHFATGGYGDDDFDHDQFLAHDFGKKSGRPNRIWYWVTWLMIAVMLITGLVVYF